MKPKLIDELKNKEFKELLSSFLEWMAREKYAESSCRNLMLFSCNFPVEFRSVPSDP